MGERPHTRGMRRLLLILTALLSLAGAIAAAPAEAAWLWPVRGEVITQYRNGSDPYAGGQHRGIDIAAPVGTAVAAAAAGEVRFAGIAGSSGLTVSVRTGDGYDTSYLHLSSIAVRAGAHVSGGERLGAIGTSGERSAAAPHLHFGVREAGSRYAYLDPLSLLPPVMAPPPSEAPKPGPVPAPAPLGPSPAPAPGRAPRPAPAPGRAPRSAPAPGRAPRPAPAPRGAPRPVPAPGHAPSLQPAPRGAPRPVPAPGRAPSLQPAPRGAPRPTHTPGSLLSAPARGAAPSTAPAPGGAPGRVSAPRHSAAPAGLHRRAPTSGGVAEGGRTSSSSSSGPDLGWALACAGLLVAGGILGLTGDGGKATSWGRSRLAGALRPLLGRR